MSATIVILTDNVKDLFKKMHFQDIPDDVKYVAFDEDGSAVFLTQIQTGSLIFPKMAIVSYYDIPELKIQY